MQILVTGSEGSLAQMVIPKFQELGHSIVGCDNLSRHGIQCREKRYPWQSHSGAQEVSRMTCIMLSLADN